MWQVDVRALDPKGVGTAVHLQAGDLALLHGGPPCQPFSQIGKKAGINDPGGQLAFQMVRFTDELRPAAVLIEQVPKFPDSRAAAGHCGGNDGVHIGEATKRRGRTCSRPSALRCCTRTASLPERGASPSVNARQVWARMASRMVGKSEVANRWGGRTIWVVQDALMDYIGRQTGLRLDELQSPGGENDEVNVISGSIDDPQDIRPYSGPVHSKGGEACRTELLNTPSAPAVQWLTDRLTENRVVATLKLQRGMLK